MTAASRSLATALWGARFASGLLPQSYTTNRDTTLQRPKLAIENARRPTCGDDAMRAMSSECSRLARRIGSQLDAPQARRTARSRGHGAPSVPTLS